MSAPPEIVPITDERRIWLLLTGPSLPTAQQLAEFILDGVYFESDPRFLPDLSEGTPEALSSLDVVWDEDRPPTRIRAGTQPERLEIGAEVEKLLSPAIAEVGTTEGIDHARRVLRSVDQLVCITLDEETVTDEAWAMVDCLEAYLAREFSGLVYAPGDGLFDADLQPIYRRPPK